MGKDSKIAAKPTTQKEIVLSLEQKTGPKKPRHYEEEEPEISSPARGSISRDPRME